jgi:uncharacterized membrane protein
VLSAVPSDPPAATGTSIFIWVAAGLVVALGMARLPLVPDRLWRFLCWSVAVVLGLYAAARIRLIPSGRIWVTWAVLLILVLALLFWIEKLREHREIEASKESSAATMSALTLTGTMLPIQPSTSPTASPLHASREPIFDQAPPELADMTPASLKELVAHKTHAQLDQLMDQHRGKPVRVSGEVEKVEFGFGASLPSVTLKTPIPFLLFFDAEDYDAKSVLLTLNKGDKIVVSGQIRKFEPSFLMEIVAVIVALDKCKVLDARAAGSKDSLP